MDYAIIWSSEALDDLEKIGEYISRDSFSYAESTVNKIFDAVQTLRRFPKVGRIVPEINNELIRELFVFQYRLIYEIKKNEVHILTVLHGRREL